MREICTSGSARGGGGNVPTYSACRLDNRTGLARLMVQLIEPGISIGLKKARVALEMLARVFPGSIA